MTLDERDELTEEQRLLKILLDFHVNNRANISMNDQEFEEYADAVLDRLNELKNILEETEYK